VIAYIYSEQAVLYLCCNNHFWPMWHKAKILLCWQLCYNFFLCSYCHHEYN